MKMHIGVDYHSTLVASCDQPSDNICLSLINSIVQTDEMPETGQVYFEFDHFIWYQNCENMTSQNKKCHSFSKTMYILSVLMVETKMDNMSFRNEIL